MSNQRPAPRRLDPALRALALAKIALSDGQLGREVDEVQKLIVLFLAQSPDIGSITQSIAGLRVRDAEIVETRLVLDAAKLRGPAITQSPEFAAAADQVTNYMRERKRILYSWLPANLVEDSAAVIRLLIAGALQAQSPRLAYADQVIDTL